MERKYGDDLGRNLSNVRWIFAVSACAVLIALYLYVPSFFGIGNFVQILRQASIPGLLALGVTFVVIAGRLDLSVGSILSASAISSVVVYNNTESAALAVIVPVFVGILVGVVNGVLVAYFQLNSLITTLATLSIVQGFALLYTGGADMVMANPASTTGLAALGRGFVAGVPVPIIVFVAVAAAAAALLHRTTYGRSVFAAGGNYLASVYSSINTNLVIFIAYLLSGALSGFAGVIYASRVATARHDSGQGMELLVLAMIILGGTNLFGGSGSIVRTILGVVVIMCLQNILLLMGLPFYSQWIGVAIVLIGVSWLNNRAALGGSST